MRRVLGPTLLLLVALAQLGNASVEAEPISLEDRLARYVKSRITGDGVQIQVPRIRLRDDERARLTPSFSIHPRQRLSGRVPVRLELLDGTRVVRTLVVPVRVDATRSALFATRSIRAGEALAADAVEVRRAPSGGLPRDAASRVGQVAGLRARRSIAGGSVIRTSRLEMDSLVERGARIRVIYQSPLLRIETSGRAREDGDPGDWIEVENLESRKLLSGRIGPDGAVYVRP